MDLTLSPRRAKKSKVILIQNCARCLIASSCLPFLLRKPFCCVEFLSLMIFKHQKRFFWWETTLGANWVVYTFPQRKPKSMTKASSETRRRSTTRSFPTPKNWTMCSRWVCLLINRAVCACSPNVVQWNHDWLTLSLVTSKKVVSFEIYELREKIWNEPKSKIIKRVICVDEPQKAEAI